MHRWSVPNGAIPTKDADASTNGWLVPLWHIDDGDRIDQVYLTVVLPFRSKGPHLHQVRAGRFVCISGNVEIVTRHEGNRYLSECSGDAHGFRVVRVAPGVPAEICNFGLEPAYVLNMPTPPWRVNEPDEWPVEDWNPVWPA